jgi:hypothetical protein
MRWMCGTRTPQGNTGEINGKEKISVQILPKKEEKE